MRRSYPHATPIPTTVAGAALSPRDDRDAKSKPHRRARKTLWLLVLFLVGAVVVLLGYYSALHSIDEPAVPAGSKKRLRSTRPTPVVAEMPVGNDKDNDKDNDGSNTCYDVLQEIRNMPPGASPYDALQSIQLLGGTIVVPGHPLTNLSVRGEAYRYFQMCIPDETSHHHFHNIRIRVKALPASPQKPLHSRLTDPDLFVSATRPHPTIVDSTWLSKHIGGEEVTIPSNHADFPPGARALYFGVHAHNEGVARFSIAVDILDRKNMYENLRLRDDDIAMRRDVEHETWKPAVE
jgi:hypothetical protein